MDLVVGTSDTRVEVNLVLILPNTNLNGKDFLPVKLMRVFVCDDCTFHADNKNRICVLVLHLFV